MANQVGGDWKRVFARSGLANDAEFTAKVARSYPFHPALIDLAENEWSLSTGFQRVRSTIQIFAATVYAQQRRAAQGEWAPGLISVGDLPLSARDVREAILELRARSRPADHCQLPRDRINRGCRRR